VHTFQGTEGRVSVRVWEPAQAHHLVVIAHGYGEHIGRYDHVARALVDRGASVWGPDHLGHGQSEGEPALIRDFEHVVDDLHHVVELARQAHPGLPLVLIGHSMGGTIAARFAQRYRSELAGLVLSGPAIGRLELIDQLLALPEIPESPIPTETLSRDPAVGQAYASDPLVYHGSFKRPLLEAFRAALERINRGPSLGDLPTLYLHGEDDQLVPRAGTRAGIDHLRGSDFTERIYPGARHEVFNELNKDEVLRDVAEFIDRVTRR
jgi:alpha-beta hydrolase superfamily lysophospholipase